MTDVTTQDIQWFFREAAGVTEPIDISDSDDPAIALRNAVEQVRDDMRERGVLRHGSETGLSLLREGRGAYFRGKPKEQRAKDVFHFIASIEEDRACLSKPFERRDICRTAVADEKRPVLSLLEIAIALKVSSNLIRPEGTKVRQLWSDAERRWRWKPPVIQTPDDLLGCLVDETDSCVDDSPEANTARAFVASWIESNVPDPSSLRGAFAKDRGWTRREGESVSEHNFRVLCCLLVNERVPETEGFRGLCGLESGFESYIEPTPPECKPADGEQCKRPVSFKNETGLALPNGFEEALLEIFTKRGYCGEVKLLAHLYQEEDGKNSVDISVRYGISIIRIRIEDIESNKRLFRSEARLILTRVQEGIGCLK